MDAKVGINITGVPFYLNSDFSLCWDNDGDSYKDSLEAKQTANAVTFDFTSSEK